MRNELPRQCRPHRVIFVCYAFPAFVLELGKRRPRFSLRFSKTPKFAMLIQKHVSRKSGTLPDSADRLPACRDTPATRQARCPSAETRWKRILLFQRKFDWLFFLARNEPVSLDDSSTSIPTQQCVVVSRWTNCFRLFEPVHRFAEKVIRLKPAPRSILAQLGFGATLSKDSGVVRALILIANAPEQLLNLCIAYAIALRKTVGKGE